MSKTNLTAAPVAPANVRTIRSHATYSVHHVVEAGTITVAPGDLVYVVPCSEKRVADAGYSKAAQRRGVDATKDKRQVAYGKDSLSVGGNLVGAELRVTIS